MTTEQKLSKLKAINGEIDQCDKSIELLVKLGSSHDFTAVALRTQTLGWDFQLPSNMVQDIRVLLIEYYEGRRTELLDTAERLML